ncbi:MAG: putative Zn-dependent hydrolase of beta-lactamase fold protein [Bacteroidetes bacterium]|nr:putative Zn-dependent hydrolase of beta-lactamase fold protein [Bacteroidota bacterium]
MKQDMIFITSPEAMIEESWGITSCLKEKLNPMDGIKKLLSVLVCCTLFTSTSNAITMKTEAYPTGVGDLKVTLLGHASLKFEYAGKVIYVDPYSQVADFSHLPKADLIVLTHEHADHLDIAAIDQIKTAKTKFIVSKSCFDQLKYGEVIRNGEKTQAFGFSIEAVPAYNLLHKRPDGQFFHPEGRGNGYVFKFGKLKVYVAGDTENIPEMSKLGLVDIAFLPKNLPYTMDDAMFLDAAKKVKPKHLYPYHFFEFNEDKLLPELKALGIDVIVRPMQSK